MFKRLFEIFSLISALAPITAGTAIAEPVINLTQTRQASANPNTKQENGIVCSQNTLFSPLYKTCASVNDKRDFSIMQRKSSAMRTPPDLAEIRNKRAAQLESKQQGMPVPGGIGAGISYKISTLQALEHSELHTQMYVYPQGINPSGPLSDLYTTATNRTEKTLEFLGWYSDAIAGSGALWLYDWSCSSVYPCNDGNTNPSFQWGKSLAELSCNITQSSDSGGHAQKIVYYDNMSLKMDTKDPPLWFNGVYLWNYCKAAWDLIYSHQFRANQKDCSNNNSCGWWGPILETFDDPLPQINELGFQGTWLLHDGIWSSLPPSETDFSNPSWPWILYDLYPNSGFGAGNYIPLKPIAFKAIAHLSGKITLSWKDASDYETFYEVYRKIGTGTYTLLETLPANIQTYIDSAAPHNYDTTTYSYYVRACNDLQCSGNTPEAIVPFVPTNVSGKKIFNGVKLTWQDNSADENGFYIYRKDGTCSSMAPLKRIKTTFANATTFSNKNLAAGTYSYRIKSFTKSVEQPSSFGYSPFSRCVTVSVP